MTTLNLEYAQDHLAELIEKAGKGESFVITKGGTPMAQLIALDTPLRPSDEQDIGMLDGQFVIPDDIKAFDRDESIASFEGTDKGAAQNSQSQLEEPKVIKRTGFMRGQIEVPDDFDTMGSAEIERLFEFGK